MATSGFYGKLAKAQSQRNKSLVEILVQWLFARWRSDPLTSASVDDLVDDTVEKVLEIMDETPC